MARLNKKEKRRKKQKQAVMALYTYITAALGIFRIYFYVMARIRTSRPQCVSNPNFYQSHIDKINRLVRGNDQDCLDQLRVNRHTFLRLCCLLQGVGLRDSRFVSLEERISIFLWILGHHTKQRRTKFEFVRSGETVSRHFNVVLQGVLRLYNMLLVKPVPVPVPPNDGDSRWSWFQNCLGALDGTYVLVQTPAVDKPRYRSRKREIAINVLGVCTRDVDGNYNFSKRFTWLGSRSSIEGPFNPGLGIV